MHILRGVLFLPDSCVPPPVEATPVWTRDRDHGWRDGPLFFRLRLSARRELEPGDTGWPASVEELFLPDRVFFQASHGL